MNRVLSVGACMLFCLAGCQQRADRHEGVFKADDGEYVLTILLDLSSSFEELMAEDGEAWAFICKVMDQYFRDRLGHSDKLILAQLSASDRSLLWRGTPLELRQKFPSAETFRDWLISQADPQGSRIYDGIVQAVEYTLDDPVLSSGNGKAALFILSDMNDTVGERPEARTAAVNALTELARQDGVVGLYFVDVRAVAKWRKLLSAAGIPASNMRVEADIVDRPVLPRFN